MDFSLTPEQQAIQRVARDFAQQEVAPLAAEYDERDEFPLHLLRRMGELGLIGVIFPAEYGGAGADRLSLLLVQQEVSKASAGVGATLLVQVLALWPVFRHGSPEQRARYLPAGIRGEIAGAIAVTEPNHGSNVAGIETQARREGDAWVIDGAKMFITNGTFADFIVTAAKTDRSLGRQGISLFIVDRGTPGLQVSRKLRKLGWHTSETAELSYQGCRVPAAQQLGPLNRGFYLIMEDFNLERLLLTAQAVGVGEAAYEAAVRYTRERVQFDRPVVEFQVIRHKLADMWAGIETARLWMYRAAWLADRAADPATGASSAAGAAPAVPGEDPAVVSAVAKYLSAEMVNDLTYDAIQLHGGAGFIADYPVERYYRDVRVLSIGGGTTQVLKDLVARRLGL
ncbi:MAG: acyl-CoA dehydrogenase family protein [Clostridia bacterium]|nr:acyl-CoA dehydrogenase family protein [Clostridia bacterium]